LPAHWPNTNRICKLTAISSVSRLVSHRYLPGSSISPLFPPLTLRQLRYAGAHRPPEYNGCAAAQEMAEIKGIEASGRRFVAACLVGLLLCGCTSIRPIVKIGLIAPFEGLYRQSGYAALAGMRQAMAECTPPGVDVLPLALDDNGDPLAAKRAAQKLLVDPTVQAIVGPLLLDAVPAVAAVITPATTIPWIVPPLLAPGAGFDATAGAAWITAQVDYVAQTTSARRILLLGLPPAWQMEIRASVVTLRIDALDAALAGVQSGDAILWLGRPDTGVRWQERLRQKFPDVPFWLASQAGIDIFAAQSNDHGGTYWLIWVNSEYNQRLQSDDFAIEPANATQDLTYRATCSVLAGLGKDQPIPQVKWVLQSRPVE
jgi:hypothetical protein